MSSTFNNLARKRVAWLLLCILIVVCFFVWQAVFALETSNVLTVAFLDVGQGDAIYIETPSGNQVLVDGGKGRSVLRELGSRMSYFDRSIDVVLATHPDADHIGGLPEVFSRYDIGMYIESGVTDSGSDNQALHEAVQNEGLTIVKARQDMKIILDTDIVLHVLFPDRDVTNLETNTSSVVVTLSYGDTSFLLTGDSPAGIETYLVSLYGNELESDVLKLGHHGSNSASSETFIGYVNPVYAVISASCDNPYGHPHKEVLNRLEQFGIKSESTCEQGTIIFTSDGERVRLR